jgi:hypothetical protein
MLDFQYQENRSRLSILLEHALCLHLTESIATATQL